MCSGKAVGIEAGRHFRPRHCLRISFEVHEYSDLGWLDAPGKPRELHIHKALAVTNFGGTAAGRTSPLRLPTEEGDRWLLAACRCFATERRETTVPFTVTISEAHDLQRITLMW
jgi:hypothetical protein